MRLLLALSGFLLCAYAGWKKAKSLQLRTDLLYAMADDITRLLMDMDYSMLPLCELIARIQPCKAPAFWKTLLENIESNTKVADAWKNTLYLLKKTDKGFSMLSDEELTMIVDFGMALGTSDIVSQRKNAEMATNRLLAHAAEISAVLKAKGKAYGSLGVLSGLALAIVIL